MKDDGDNDDDGWLGGGRYWGLEERAGRDEGQAHSKMINLGTTQTSPR